MGAGHCGSTLLDLILGSHSQAFSLGEFKQFDSRLSAHEATGGPVCGVCTENCEIWQGRLLKGLKPLFGSGTRVQKLTSSIGLRLCNPYRLINECTKKDIIVDSSKHPAWIRSRLAHKRLWNEIQPFLIYLHRDGRAVTNSYFRKYPERTYPTVVDDWVNQVEQMEDYYEVFDAGSKLRLGYESLADSPSETMQKICQFLGIEFESEMLGYWQHNHHHLGGNGGTRHLIFRYREQFSENSNQLNQRIIESKKHYSHEYYDAARIAIKLDERWRNELSSEQLQVFAKRAEHANAPYIYRSS